MVTPYHQTDNTTLYHGDALAVLRSLDADSFDLIVTDPPYFKVKGEWWDRQWNKPAEFLAWIGELCDEWQRVLRGNGSLYCFASPQMAARVECEIGRRFCVLENITWVKPDPSCEINRGAGRGGQCCKETLRAWFPRTEEILFAEHYNADNAAKGEGGYGRKCDELRGFVFEPLRAYLDGELGRSPLTKRWLKEQWMRETGTKSEMPRHWFEVRQWELPTAKNYEWLQRHLNASCNGSGPQYLRREYEDLRREYEDLRREYEDLRREYEDLRRPFNVTADVPYTDVWDFPTVQHYRGKHPCEKPAALIEHILRVSGRDGCRVLDCFAGSGVVLETARRLGYHAAGVEIEEKWCRRIADRLGQRRLKGIA